MRPEFLPQPSRELRREISGREPADVGAERKEEHSAVNPVETLGENVGPYPSSLPLVSQERGDLKSPWFDRCGERERGFFQQPT